MRMDDLLMEPEVSIQEAARDFAQKELKPGAAERDASGLFPYDLYAQCAELGFPGIPFSEASGGVGADWFTFVLAIEEFARVDSGFASTVCVTADVASLLQDLGTDEQRDTWMKPLIQGGQIAAFALTEPHSGSDPHNMKTRAACVDGHWVINGNKAFITNSGTDISLFAVVFCNTGETPLGRKEFSAIVVPNATPGYTVLPGERTIGWKSSDIHQLILEDCRVPVENLVGPQSQGLRAALETLKLARVTIAAVSVGLAQGCLDECIRYAHERSAFGRSLGAIQAIQQQIAEMATNVEAARRLTYHAAHALDAGELHSKEASMAKLFSSEVAQRAAVMACDIHGGMGFMEEVPVARYYRDAKALTIVEGTSNIQKTVIARELGLPRS